MNRLLNSSFIFLIMIPLFLSSCKNKLDTVAPPPENAPLETGYNVEILYSDSAIIRAKLKSPVVNRYVDSATRVLFPKGIRMDFFDENGKITSWMTSEYAIRYENEKKMEARKNVVVVNENGEKLNTEHLTWDQEKQIIYTNEPVKITTKKEVMYGDGLESNESFTKYRIKKPKGIFSIEENE